MKTKLLKKINSHLTEVNIYNDTRKYLFPSIVFYGINDNGEKIYKRCDGRVRTEDLLELINELLGKNMATLVFNLHKLTLWKRHRARLKCEKPVHKVKYTFM